MTPSSTPPASLPVSSPAPAQVFVGIDIGKDHLDVATLDRHAPAPLLRRFDNTPAGIALLLEQLQHKTVVRIVVEASGPYDRAIVAACHQAQLPIARIQPHQAKAYAKVTNQKAKTDALDAALLARYAQNQEPRLTPPQSAVQVELDALVARRRQVVDLQSQEKCRLEAAPNTFIKKEIEKLLRQLHDGIKKLDKKIARLIADDADLSGKNQILQSVPGVGPATSATLLAETPELGTLDRKKISSLAGVAPFNHDSGRMKGQRGISGGRAPVRTCLYMATLTARTHHPQIKAFAQRLTAAGKPFKVMMVACMRKLLTILNAMVRDATPYQSPQAAVAA